MLQQRHPKRCRSCEPRPRSSPSPSSARSPPLPPISLSPAPSGTSSPCPCLGTSFPEKRGGGKKSGTEHSPGPTRSPPMGEIPPEQSPGRCHPTAKWGRSRPKTRGRSPGALPVLIPPVPILLPVPVLLAPVPISVFVPAVPAEGDGDGNGETPVSTSSAPPEASTDPRGGRTVR